MQSILYTFIVIKIVALLSSEPCSDVIRNNRILLEITLFLKLCVITH